MIMKSEDGNLKIEQGRQTVFRIIKVASELFSTKGYKKTSTEEIVSKVGVTRGALYHHFRGKRDIFIAVFEKAQCAIKDFIINETKGITDPWQKLIKGNYAFLRGCIDPEIQQIVAVDAPSVLGWEVWRDIDRRYSTLLLKEFLEKLQDAGVIRPLPIEPLTHAMAGAANGLALWLSEIKDTKEALEEAQSTMEVLFNAIHKKSR